MPTPLASRGYFFVGGQYVENGGRKLMAGQMYLEYMTPATVTHSYPIVMIHGTAQTGTNFTATPDGRRGWADDFVSRGYRVYIVDQVGRGRSGTLPEVYGPYMRFPADREERSFTAPEKYNLWPQAKLHTQWPGGPGVIGNAATYDHCTSKFLMQAGVPNAHIMLADVNVRGNAHMMMLEANSSEIAAVIARWLDRSVK